MSILKVTDWAIPCCAKSPKNLSAKDIQSAKLQKFIDDMIETMREYDGVGLAADQVHESKQVCVLEVGDNPRYPDKSKVPLTVLINPKITPLSEETEDDLEGCLSIPICAAECRVSRAFVSKLSIAMARRWISSPMISTRG